MAPKRRLPHTFPHRIIFATAFLLCLCAGTTIAFAVLAWSRLLWGYYWWTGFWSGAVILFAGIFGIVCSFVRNTCSVKTFMIIAIFGCIVSLGVIALSAGGLDADSGFYTGDNQSSFLSFVCHAVYLGTGVLQLALCVLADGICIYYLFYEKSATLYRVKDAKKKNKKNNIVRNGNKNRSSSASQAPLLSPSAKPDKKKKKPKQKKTKQKNGNAIQAEDQEFQDDMPIVYTSTSRPLSAKLLRKQEQQTSRNTCVRSASFSTFGHKDVPERDRVSLIVHSPDDNLSVIGTTRTHTPDPQRDSECHYAQTLLFDPPLPIEEDDELPPYEVVDTHTYTNVQPKKQKRTKSERVSKDSGKAPVKRSKSVPSRAKNAGDRSQRISSRRLENIRFENDVVHSDSDQVLHKQFHSADLLADNIEMHANAQGVVRRDFAHSSDRILMRDVHSRHGRPQSAKIVREKRLDRRRRALSAEVKLTKDQIMIHGSHTQNKVNFRSRTNSLDGSNSSLFASNRILPTKFSLRTPMRQIGMPHVCSPVPVKPVQTSSLKLRPPPKPPRTHSVTLADLQADEVIYADADDVFASLQRPIGRTTMPNVTEEQVNESKSENVEKQISDKTKETTLSNKEKGQDFAQTVNITTEKPVICNKGESQQTDTELNPESSSAPATTSELNSTKVQIATLDSGPVLKCVPPKTNVNTCAKEVATAVTSKPLSSIMSIPTSPIRIMSVPTSPILKQPPKPQDSRTTENKPPSADSDHPAIKQDVLGTSDGDNKILKYNDLDKAEDKRKLDDKDVVYAKINEENKELPGMKIQKSRKLLFSFSDKDQINVFDPSPVSENAPGSGSEVVAEVVDTFSIKHTAEPEKWSKFKSSDSSNLAELKAVHVSPIKSGPANSSTQRVLQRKNLNSSISFGNENTVDANNPRQHNIANLNNGARPKTSFKSAPKIAPKPGFTNKPNENGTVSNPSMSFPQNSRSSFSSPGVSAAPSISYVTTSSRPIPAARWSGFAVVNNSDKDSLTSKNNVQTIPFSRPLSAQTPQVNRDHRTLTSSSSRPLDVRVSPLSSASPSTNSQGILHMPQSQHARQVPAVDGAQGQGGLNQAVVANAQIVANAQPVNVNNEDDDETKPFFSVVL